MRSYHFIMALALLPLLAACNRSSDQEIAAKPPAELLGDTTPSSAQPAVSEDSASNAGVALVLARDVCQIPKADFERLAQYYSGVIGEDMKLKAAFVVGAKTGTVIREDSTKKGQLDQLKSVACPAVERTIASLPDAKQG
jgi:hypothetical protein